MDQYLYILSQYKSTILLVLGFLFSLLLLFNFGLILKLIGLYYVSKFLYKNLLFAKDRDDTLLKLKNLVKEVTNG